MCLCVCECLTLSVLQVQHPPDLGQGHEGDVLEVGRGSGLAQGAPERTDHLVTLPGNLEAHTHTFIFHKT